MKKLIYIAIMTLSLLSFTACSKTLKSDNLDVEVTLPGLGWKAVTDTSESFVISKKSDMVSYTTTDIPENYKMPTTENELAELVGADIMAVSKIEGFNYETNEDGTEQNLYYKQTLTVGNESSVLINNYKIHNGKLVTAIATLTNADEEKIAEIETIVKSTTLK